MKSDGTFLCRCRVNSASRGVTIQKVTTSGWHVYICVLDIHAGVTSYFDGDLKESYGPSDTKTAEWATLDGTIDRVKVAEITGLSLIHI